MQQLIYSKIRTIQYSDYITIMKMQINATPLFILILLCSVQFIVYYDRGLMASYVGTLQSILQPQPINDTSMGVLGSAFVAGFMCSCPVFGMLLTHLSYILQAYTNV